MGGPVHTYKFRDLQVLAVVQSFARCYSQSAYTQICLGKVSISQGKAGLLEPCYDFVRALGKALLEGGAGESSIHLFLPLICYVKLM